MTAAPDPTSPRTGTGPELVSLVEQPTAVVRGRVPADELPAFYDRAFGLLAEVIAAQGVTIAGPAFGLYPAPPGDDVELEVGFPVEGAVEPDGEVQPGSLPAGTAAHAVHHGSFDGLGAAWADLAAWIEDQGMVATGPMWEVYVTEPSPDMDPADLRTELWQPVTSR